ncbi:MAG: nucleotidyltransferase family protein [Lentilitoribacter sp.]
MEAIILAGGRGTRLKSVVADLPKPMADIAGSPFLEILLRRLEKFGYSHVILSLGYMAEKIISYVEANQYSMKISFEVENKPLGTGGAIRRALIKCNEDHVYIFNGDTFLDFDVNDTENFWDKEKCPVMVGHYLEDTSRYGRLIVEDGFVTGFIEKGKPNPGFINGGCYVIPLNYLDKWNLDENFSIENDHFAHSINQEKMGFIKSKSIFVDIGVPEDYFRAQKILREMR